MSDDGYNQLFAHLAGGKRRRTQGRCTEAPGSGWPGSACIAGAEPLTRAHIMADIILTQMDRAGLRRGMGTHEDPIRPNWKEMTEWCETALNATSQNNKLRNASQ